MLRVAPPNDAGSDEAMSDMTMTVGGDDATAADPLGHERPRHGFLSWVPTDRDQLAKTESRMLAYVGRPLLQRFVAGLNTISSFPAQRAFEAARQEEPDPRRSLRVQVESVDEQNPDEPEAAAAARAPPASQPRTMKRATRHIVLVHGFAGGAACWTPNLQYLIDAAQHENQVTQIHAIDAPGFARSDRHPMATFKNESDAMRYMTGHLHEWFKGMGLLEDSRGRDVHVDLVGHSFGAYICASFAEKHPAVMQRLVLVDPWGVPPQRDPNAAEKLPFKFRMALRLFYGASPLSVLRATGPWGPSLLPKLRQDFADRWAPIVGDPNIFFDYIYHCNANESATGERAFQACCTGPVFARRPLEWFVPSLPSSIDMAVLYGDRSFMDRTAGREMVDEMIKKRPESQNTFALVPNAGHQVFTDNVDGFNAALGRELRLAVEGNW